jgi:hypothetical protein
MNAVKAWSQLNRTDRERVQLMLFSLKEFSFGYETADHLSDAVEEGSAAMRFYMNSLYQYCCNYYLVGGPNKLRNILQELGSGDLLQPLDTLLALPLGETTFGEILRTYRDKFLTHPTFTLRPLQTKIYRKFDLPDPDNHQLFAMLVNDLFVLTRQLYFALAARFPEALTSEFRIHDT